MAFRALVPRSYAYFHLRVSGVRCHHPPVATFMKQRKWEDKRYYPAPPASRSQAPATRLVFMKHREAGATATRQLDSQRRREVEKFKEQFMENENLQS